MNGFVEALLKNAMPNAKSIKKQNSADIWYVKCGAKGDSFYVTPLKSGASGFTIISSSPAGDNRLTAVLGAPHWENPSQTERCWRLPADAVSLLLLGRCAA